MKLEKLSFMVVFLLFSTLVLTFCPCSFADSNMITDWQCSRPDNSTTDNDNNFLTNLKNLFNSLSVNGPIHNGFYAVTEGEKNNIIYGLIQCRGDISPNDCAICIKNATAFVSTKCPHSKQVVVWFRWCLLHFSNQSFFGVMNQFSLAVMNDSNYDDASIVPKGLAFMSGLAVAAPDKPLMFESAVLDVGEKGKRYGMAQCNRDISWSDCGQCLDGQLVSFRTTVGNKKDWEIYGFSCSMWYHDHQFYFNYSTTTNGGTRLLLPEAVVIISITIAVMLILLVMV